MMTRQAKGEESYETAVNKILKAILRKSVQLHYSACGKKKHGVGKLNFSETQVFKCMTGL